MGYAHGILKKSAKLQTWAEAAGSSSGSARSSSGAMRIRGKPSTLRITPTRNIRRVCRGLGCYWQGGGCRPGCGWRMYVGTVMVVGHGPKVDLTRVAVGEYCTSSQMRSAMPRAVPKSAMG